MFYEDREVTLINMQYLLLGFLFLTVDLEDSPIPDPRPTVLIPMCTDTQNTGIMLFKAENNKRRVIVRSVHCGNT